MKRLIALLSMAAIIGCASANQATQTNFQSGSFGLTATEVIPTLSQIRQAPFAAAGITPNSVQSGQPFIVQFATSGCSSCQTDARVFAASQVPVFVVLGDKAEQLIEPLVREFNTISSQSAGSMAVFVDSANQDVNRALTRRQSSIWANHLMVACNRSGNCKLFTENAASAQQQHGVPVEAANAQQILSYANAQ